MSSAARGGLIAVGLMVPLITASAQTPTINPGQRLEETVSGIDGENAERAAMEAREQENMGGDPRGRGRPSRRNSSPMSDAIETYLGNLDSLTTGFKLTSLLKPSELVVINDGGPILAKEAEQAFVQGDQGLALSLLYGHMVAEYDKATRVIGDLQYCRLLRRPVWNIRFGISIAIRGDALIDADPIREGATPRGRPASGRVGRGRGRLSQRESGEPDMRAMEQEAMAQEADLAREAQMEMSAGMQMGSDGPPGRRGRRKSSMSGPSREMLDRDASDKLDKTVGLVAEVLAQEFNDRFRRGDFGSLLTSVTAPAPVESVRGSRTNEPPPRPSMSDGLMDALGETTAPLPMWQPGITYLGEEAWQDMLPIAKENHLDMILHLDVVLKTSGRDNDGDLQNISRCRLVNVATGKSIGASKAMDNREAAQLASSGRSGERAYVKEQLGYLFSIFDRQIKVADMPEVNQDVARRRIASLMSSTGDRKLRSLAEIRYYQSKDLISESEVETAFDIIGGVDALMLLHGPAEERISTVRKMAVEGQGTDSDS